MKRVNKLMIVLAVSAGFFSCKKTINCDTPVLRKVLFYTNVSTYTVPDTTAMLVKYNKGSSFSEVSEIFQPIYLMKEDIQNKSMEFPLKGKETYDYDWKITLKPSNRVYTISAASHESATSKTHHCTNTVSYKINDSLVTVPGNPYSATPYFVADILIEYY